MTASAENTIRIAEIFGPTIQGEGALIGAPSVFVRTGGCDFRCAWCDSLHAVESAYREQWAPMAAEAIWAEIVRLSGGRPLWVSLSGGNPAIQPLGPLIALGKPRGYRFALETQGSIAQPWFADLDMLVLSPKPPSSGMKTNWAVVDACAALALGRSMLKIVVFDREDYAYARAASARLPELEVVLQPGNPTPPAGDDDRTPVDIPDLLDRMEQLVEWTLADGWFEARILPQLHVLLWGNKRGV